MTTKTNLPEKTLENAINLLLPVYGSKGLDIPVFDSDKHMYLVDQYQYESGNRTLTYVAISDRVIVEVVLGHYYGWEYMNKLRILTPDVTKMKVIKTKEWKQSTRFDRLELSEAVADGLDGYIASSSAVRGFDRNTIRKEAEKMTTELFSRTEGYLDSPLGRRVLLSYCEDYNYCRDFVKYAL